MKQDLNLSANENQRYARHLLLNEVKQEGQLKLKNARVLIVGVGGLGSPVGLYLAAAGVGQIGLVDFDRVEVSNLQRQIAFTDSDLGRLKVEAAQERFRAINPGVEVQAFPLRLNYASALELFPNYDVIVDGTDNFSTRYLINDVCVNLRKPFVYASIFRFEGQISVFGTQGHPCYRCLFPEPPLDGIIPNCSEVGVIGVLPGMIGTIQANEVIKLILNLGSSLSGRLLLLDALEMRFRELKIKKNPQCSSCGKHSSIRRSFDYEQMNEVVCNGMKADHDFPLSDYSLEIEPADLKKRLNANEDIFILDVRGHNEYVICNMGGCLIPLHELEGRLGEIDRNATIVVHCASGTRSKTAVTLLKKAGFQSVLNLKGGIHAWMDLSRR